MVESLTAVASEAIPFDNHSEGLRDHHGVRRLTGAGVVDLPGRNDFGMLLPVSAPLDTALEPATTGITREARDRVRTAIRSTRCAHAVLCDRSSAVIDRRVPD